MRVTVGCLALIAGLGLSSGAVSAEGLGEVEVEAKAGPQMGEYAWALRLSPHNEAAVQRLLGTTEAGLHDFVGIAPIAPHKVAILHFFSYANQRSVDDLTALQKLYDRYGEEGLVVLAVNLDPDKASRIDDMVEKEEITFPILDDRFGVVARRYVVRHMPTVYVIDGQGRVGSVREGYSEDISVVLGQEVKALLESLEF